ncbi:MAG: thermitase [Solirubrobacterales bacterium]|nr:thermitase [Solirubrobacterales bacterium]
MGKSMGNRRRAARLTGATVLLAALVALAGAAGAARAAAGGGPPVEPTGRLVVMVAPPGKVGDGGVNDPSSAAGKRRARNRIAAVLRRTGLTATRSIPELGAATVDPSAGQTLAGLRVLLESQPGVTAVRPEYSRRVLYSPNDPGLASEDSTSPNEVRQWNLIREGFRRAWGYGHGEHAPLAVIDTGIDGTHADLSGRIVAAVNQVGSGGAKSDEYGHGTHVAGLACASGDNGYGMTGAAYRCPLIVEKASSDGSLDDGTIAASILDATKRGARVINMSFGNGGTDPVVKNAIDYAWSHGVVMVAAAVNSHDTDQGYPAKYLQPDGTGQTLRSGKGLVVTGAYYNGNNAATGYGTGISLAAYGFSTSSLPGIFSTFPANCTAIENAAVLPILPCQKSSPPRTTFRGQERWAYLQGTSMATPQVAGAVAVLRGFRPRLSARTVLTIVKEQANGEWSSELGWGVLNAGKTLAYAKTHYRR